MPGEAGEPFQQPAGRQEKFLSPLRGEGKGRTFPWSPKQIVERLRQRQQERAWQALLERSEQAVDPVRLLFRAKQGVEAFRKAYEAGDQEWRHLLTETDLGEELQAMYLGLKPALTIDEPSERGMVIKNLHRRFGIAKTMLVYDRELVREVMKSNPDIFPLQGQSIDEYMRVLGLRWEETSGVEVGLLLGFPRNAVLQYVKNNDIFRIFGYTTDTYGQQLAPSEQAMRFRYRKGYKDVEGATAEDFQMSVNRFWDEYKDELRILINKVFPGKTIPEEAKTYLLTARFVLLPGINYVSGTPDDSDYSFAQRVRNVFEHSGMNAYLASVKS